MKAKKIYSVFLVLVLTTAAWSKVIIYKIPPTAKASKMFQVKVDGKPVFVEELPVTKEDVYYDFKGADELNYHCVRFAFDKSVRLNVIFNGDLKDFLLMPSGISAERKGSTVRFTLKKPRNLLFKVRSSWLYIFADPPESDVPLLEKTIVPGVRGKVPKFYIDRNMKKIINVRDYRVDTTGRKLCTKQIQRAIIDAAVGPYPGGIVYVPPGVYKIGQLRLYSGVTLYLQDGALLQGSQDPADYPLPFGLQGGTPKRDFGYDYALIRVHDCDNVTICGRGTIDAGGQANGRLKIIHMQNSKHITVKDIVLRNTTGWMFPILYCEDILVQNIRLFSPITANTDGINPDCSVDVTLNGNFIVTGDDAVAVKATNFGKHIRDEIRDIRIINNVMLTMKSALKIGTETQARLIHDILFENNDVLLSDRAFTIYLRDGALVDRVIFRNNRVEMAGGLRDDKNRIVEINISTRGDDIWRTPDFSYKEDHPGQIRFVLFENTSVNTKESLYLSTSKISGFDESNNVRNITFRNFRVNGNKIKNPADMISFGKDTKKTPFLSVDQETTENIQFE